MTTDRERLAEALRLAKPRSLDSTLFNLAHAYSRAGISAWQSVTQTRDADFAGPALMCESFAVELLLKFFLVIDHPGTKTVRDLAAAGVKLKCHRYSELYDQLSSATKDRIAAGYSAVAGRPTDSIAFRAELIAQGDDPFVYWRYVYETTGESHFDKKRFDLVIDGLGKAAETDRRASPGM